MAKEKKAPTAELVPVDAKLRKLYSWVDALAVNVQNRAVMERREKERLRGPQLSAEQLRTLADELDSNQEAMNRLSRRRDEITEKLLAHWGYTGIKQISSLHGQTLIATQFQIGVDPEILKREIDAKLWRRITAAVLQPGLMLIAGQNPGLMRDAVAKAIAVKQLKVTVTPPSSRRPKSGERKGEEDTSAGA